MARWVAADEPSTEIAFTPARVLMQDFTGVPAIVDLAAMRDAMDELGGDPAKINPLVPVELVIDHSIQVDVFAERLAFQRNAELEFERNRERYAFLRWGQTAFDNFSVVPPNTGICHQVNLEYLARVVETRDGQAFPDTLVGTDSHTTMINGLGVLGWGVGGIEAEAAMLGQPVSMLIPQVVGFRLTGELPEGATATDLVLTVTQMLRERGVVGKFVEFYGPGPAPTCRSPTAPRSATWRPSTAPPAGSSRSTPRRSATSSSPAARPSGSRWSRPTAASRGCSTTPDSEEPVYSDTLELDLGDVVPSLAGPKRPQDRVSLADAAERLPGRAGGDDRRRRATSTGYDASAAESFPASDPPTANGGGSSPKPGHVHAGTAAAERGEGLGHGAVVIAAITSCTNTSNPSVMLGAGLLAKKAVEAGLTRKPWVKTWLAPGSKVVTEYLERAGLIEPLSALGFDLVGYGCTTCIGNSGPLPEEISREIEERDLVVASVLSGNRNFEGRIHPEVKMNYLASPPLCVAYALAGRMDVDLLTEPLQGDVRLDATSGPAAPRSTRRWRRRSSRTCSARATARCSRATRTGTRSRCPTGDRYAWDPDSTYVRRPPYFEGMPASAPEGFEEIRGARVLAVLGDSVTTDHISPAGAIKKDSPAGEYLIEHGVEQRDFNSYGSRRGNHEVMMRGTFANIRLRNQLAPGTEGGFTKKDGEVTTIYEAAMDYASEGVPLCVLAGKEYGSGSSRDWAAKGPRLLGVRFVIAESYERIHRSNLVGMGILPLQFPDGESAASLGLTGEETFDLEPL